MTSSVVRRFNGRSTPAQPGRRRLPSANGSGHSQCRNPKLSVTRSPPNCQHYFDEQVLSIRANGGTVGVWTCWTSTPNSISSRPSSTKCAARSCDLEIGCCDTDQLRRASVAVDTFCNMTDAIKADIAARGAQLRQAGNSKPVDDAVNPGGRKPPAAERADADRAGVLGHLPVVG